MTADRHRRHPPLPGRDRRAVLHRAPRGAAAGDGSGADGRHVVVIGGGIAGLSAATVLAERGVGVTLLEREDTWGGRARSWPLPDGRSMSRGFHAFFRQYYTLRGLIARADPGLTSLRSIGDYPLQLRDGPRDSFARIPRTPPWSVAAFALTSPSFPLRQLARVNLPAATGLLRPHFPAAFSRLDGISAQQYLDRLRFPTDARHLALEVFARSFFADPRDFSAGELLGMFHTYFLGSAEGLVFDVPTDAYSERLWDPLVTVLRRHGAEARPRTTVRALRSTHDGVRVTLAGTGGADGTSLAADAVVLAADPRSARRLLTAETSAAADWPAWCERVARQRNAPPFAVWRLWLDRAVAPRTPAFLGTSDYGPLDNVSVLERFEATAQHWHARHGGSVVELHAYALPEPVDEAALRRELSAQLQRLHPELADATTVHEEWLLRDDCPLIDTGPWADRPQVRTPDPRIVLSGDWLRTDEPVALMERAALTGLQAANQLLDGWGVTGQDWWSVPMHGLLGVRRRRR